MKARKILLSGLLALTAGITGCATDQVVGSYKIDERGRISSTAGETIDPRLKQKLEDYQWTQKIKPLPWEVLAEGGPYVESTADTEIMRDELFRYTERMQKKSETYQDAKKEALNDGSISTDEARTLLPLLKEAIIANQDLRNYAREIEPTIVRTQKLNFHKAKIGPTEERIDSYQKDWERLAQLTK